MADKPSDAIYHKYKKYSGIMIHTDKGITIPEYYFIIYITRQNRLSEIYNHHLICSHSDKLRIFQVFKNILDVR